jgi:uncharacterized protein
VPPLSQEEVRVLGSLLEKETTTPEYYPMTLNALMAACNQKSNRDPMVSYDEETVRDALASMRPKGLVMEISGAGYRVPKYAHRLPEAINLGRREFALLCTLMLRGPQTLGELRDRSERMYEFSDLEEVEHVLDTLAARDPDPLVVKLPRLPGTKEPRYAHLFCGQPDLSSAASEPARSAVGGAAALSATAERIAALETQLAALREEIAGLRSEFAQFRKQFE